MAILANRTKIRNSLLELSKFVLYSVNKFFTIILLTLSFSFLYFSSPKPISDLILEASGKILSVGSLIYSETINSFKLINERLSYFKDLEAENLQLKLKIADLEKSIQINSNLKSENLSLKNMLNVIDVVKKDFITAKVVGFSITPFSSSATIEIGDNSNIKINDIVRGFSGGLVGRITNVSSNYSTITLIDDHDSRIPIITDKTKTRGIIAKQNDHLKIIYSEEGSNILADEIVYTSGEGKIFPKGIAVAKITKITNNIAFVEPLERLNKIEYVLIESKP